MALHDGRRAGQAAPTLPVSIKLSLHSGAVLRRIGRSGQWRVESTYSGLVSAPVAVATSLLLPSRPDNALIRFADRVEQALASRHVLDAWHQYVLLNLVRLP